MQTPLKRGAWHDAYDLQMALWRWTRQGAIGHEYLYEHYRETSRALGKGTTQLIQSLYLTENAKLLAADPIYVSEEMCEVVEAAYPGFHPEALLPTDLLTVAGFMFYAKPFRVIDRFETPTTIAAVSWMPMTADKDTLTLGPDMLLSHFQEKDYTRPWTAETASHPVDGIAITLYAKVKESSRWLIENGSPNIIPFHLTPWWFGMTFEGNEVDENGDPTGAGWWWRIVQTSFRMMMQQISVRHREHPDRHTRREGARRGFTDREVVVVRLRREKGDTHDDESLDGEANYSHRFIVSGHWRNQWYPSAHVHRQIWISPYVKGPEDQPLVVRPRRVFTWSR